MMRQLIVLGSGGSLMEKSRARMVVETSLPARVLA
jgi:hypothetical protein